MKRVVILFLCLILLAGCTSSRYISEKEAEEEMEIDEMKKEVYRQGYIEGYVDGSGQVLNEIPWYLIDAEELENALSMVFEDEAYAEEIRDQIFSYCELYERSDFVVDFVDSNEEIDYDY